ncbi:MAG: hypothetical protein ILA02_03230 [Clostridia bacterium]|nr:hypothetical protein [Clostridia bacterium]
MNKKNKLMNAISIVVSVIITFFIAHSRYVNRMPMAIDNNDTYKKSILEDFYNYYLEDFYDLFLGRGFVTLLVSLLTVTILFIINKLIIKQENKFKYYAILFCIIFVFNMLIYRIGIRIAV